MNERGTLYKSFFAWLDQLAPEERTEIQSKWQQMEPPARDASQDDARLRWIDWCVQTKGFRKP